MFLLTHVVLTFCVLAIHLHYQRWIKCKMTMIQTQVHLPTASNDTRYQIKLKSPVMSLNWLITKSDVNIESSNRNSAHRSWIGRVEAVRAESYCLVHEIVQEKSSGQFNDHVLCISFRIILIIIKSQYKLL